MLVSPEELSDLNFDHIDENSDWESGTTNELLMHKIHHYPAKFKSFIVTKSIEYAKLKNKNVGTIGDVFCGCGTTALEARINGIDFWGYDINPIATLIAEVKSRKYSEDLIYHNYEQISETFEKTKDDDIDMDQVNERIRYWFEDDQTRELHHLLEAIKSVPNVEYRDFFLVGFSNILKGTSRWLSSSIKPQIDPNKKPRSVEAAFKRQIMTMKKAAIQSKELLTDSKVDIKTTSILQNQSEWPKADLIITSPPYATSYEYADIHQLSTLWLGYVNDYRDLRKGTIGSKAINLDEFSINELNSIGREMYNSLKPRDGGIAKSVAKYFLDMDASVRNIYKMIEPNGLAFLVVGNTRYRGVDIDNAKYISKCMMDHGFKNIDVIKRKITSKTLTPYRDEIGRFVSSKNKKTVYAHEYIIIGEKTSSVHFPATSSM